MKTQERKETVTEPSEGGEQAGRKRLGQLAEGSIPRRPVAPRWLSLGGGVSISSQGQLRIDPDIFLPSRGLPVEINFYYNSQSQYDGPFGFGRTMSYNRYIQEDIATGNATVITDEGQARPYTKSGTVFTAPTGFADKLTKGGDGTFGELRMNDQVYFSYDASNPHQLTSVKDLAGDTHTIFRASGLMNKLTDADGRAVYFNYDAGRLSQMIDWGLRVQTFTYMMPVTTSTR